MSQGRGPLRENQQTYKKGQSRQQKLIDKKLIFRTQMENRSIQGNNQLQDIPLDITQDRPLLKQPYLTRKINNL